MEAPATSAKRGWNTIWFSRLKRRISHSEARSLLRRVFANCTAANPPPTMTTLIGFTSLFVQPGLQQNLIFPGRVRDGKRKQDSGFVHKDRKCGIMGISEDCGPY